MNSLLNRIIKTELINWSQLKFIQQGDFKKLAKEDENALKNSIIQNHFSQPFYVWQDETINDLYCLDGKHRVDALLDLISDGFQSVDGVRSNLAAL